MTNQTPLFKPDWVSPPGDTILDLMDEKGLSKDELTVRLGCSVQHFRQLLKGNVPLSESMALQLEKALGGTARFWCRREAKYRQHLSRLGASQSIPGGEGA